MHPILIVDPVSRCFADCRSCCFAATSDGLLRAVAVLPDGPCRLRLGRSTFGLGLTDSQRLVCFRVTRNHDTDYMHYVSRNAARNAIGWRLCRRTG